MMPSDIWIPEYLTNSQVESADDKTVLIDLPKNEQISFLQLDISALGAATPRTTTTLIDEIASYEVIADGSKVLYSLEPELAYYLDFVARGGIYPRHSFNYTPNARETHEFMIPFGRFPFDRDYMLDTSLYKNVQLRIRYTLNTARFQTGTFRHTVILWRPLEKLAPIGFIRSRAIRKQTSSGSVETLEHLLPTTYPYHYLAARIEDDDQNIDTDVTGIKLDFNQGRLILADLDIDDWMDQDELRYPEKNYYLITPALSNGTTVKAPTNYPYPRASFSSATRALMWKLSSAVGEQVALNVYEQDGTVVTDSHTIQVHVGGAFPHKCLTLYDGRQHPFPAPNYAEGRAKYTLAAYTQIIHTFVQERVQGALT